MSRFAARFLIPFGIFTVLLYGAALALVIVLFPGISNLWIAVLVLIGSFTDALATLFGLLAAQGEKK